MFTAVLHAASSIASSTAYPIALKPHKQCLESKQDRPFVWNAVECFFLGNEVLVSCPPSHAHPLVPPQLCLLHAHSQT